MVALGALTTGQAALLLGLTHNAVRRLVAGGQLKASLGDAPSGGTKIRIPLDQFVRYGRQHHYDAAVAWAERQALAAGLPLAPLPSCLVIAPGVEMLPAFEGAGLDCAHASSFLRAGLILGGRSFAAVVIDQACGTAEVMQAAADLPGSWPGVLLGCLANEDEEPERIRAAGYRLVWQRPADPRALARDVRAAIGLPARKRGGDRKSAKFRRRSA